MLVYIANFFSIYVYNWMIKNKGIFVGLVSLQLFLILALRANDLGPDLIAYQEMYYYIGSLSWDNMWSRLHLISTADLAIGMGIESGYVIFNWIVCYLGFSYHGFLVISALLTIVPVGIFIYRYSLNPALSFLIYISTNLYFYNFGILRQSLAVSILICAVPFLLKKRLIPSVCFILLAFTFHRVAVLWIPLSLVIYYPLNGKMFSLLCVTALGILGVFAVSGTSFLSPLLTLLGKSHYMTNEFAANNMIILLFLLAGFLCVLCDISNLTKNLLYNLLIWGLLVCLYFEAICTFTPLARALPLVLIFIPILLPNMLYHFRYRISQRGSYLLRFIITNGLIGFLFIYMILQLRGSIINPYRFY